MFVDFKMIVRLTGGKIVRRLADNFCTFCAKRSSGQFLYFVTGEYSFETDDFSNFFGHFWRRAYKI